MSTSDTELIHLRITGMTCGACVSRVESALKRVDGVENASVNLMAESADVQLSNGTDQNKALLESVRGAGYEAEIVPTGQSLLSQWADDKRQRETLRRHRQALIQAIGLALPIVVLEFVIPLLWPGDDPGAQMPGRFMQLILLIMLAVSPAGGPILAGGIRAILHFAGNMDVLITVAVLAATIGGTIGVVIGEPHLIHFEAAAIILAIVCVGRYLETKVRGRATEAIAALARRSPKEADVFRDGDWRPTPTDRIKIDDKIQITEGGTVPSDGIIESGEAEFDERFMTGESMPVSRKTGDRVSSGAIVASGRVVIRATADGAGGAMNRILNLVQAAQQGRTRMQRLADQIAGVFVGIIVVIAAITILSWGLLEPSGGWAIGMKAAIAVLVVACPCALGLATPTVTLAASGVSAQRGIMARDAAALETLGRIKSLIWDKTGTLTVGEPRVERIVVRSETVNEAMILKLVAGAERFSAHPIAKAIVREAKRQNIDIPTPESFESKVGRGLKANVAKQTILVGSERWMQDNTIELPIGTELDAPNPGTIIINVAIDGAFAGKIYLRDTLRPSAAAAVARLNKLNIESFMLSGDAAETSREVGDEIGIPSERVRGDADPESKVSFVKEKKNDGPTGMVGDGINDAAALTQADVGIAFATGTDVAVESADISLIGSTPHLVADAVLIARGTTRLIRENLAWAFGYNIIMIPLAAIGKLPPALSAAAMMFSSIAVVLNAMRLPKWIAKREREEGRE